MAMKSNENPGTQKPAPASAAQASDTLKNPQTKNTSTKQKKLLRAALALCVCVMVAAAALLGRYYYHVLMQWNHEREIRAMYDEIISNRPDDQWANPPQNPIVLPPDATLHTVADTPSDEESEWQKELRRLLEMEERGKETFAEFLSINEDFRGMIQIPGLMSPLPYVHSSDNREYLNTDFNGRTSPVGTVFLDAWNDRLLTDRNNVLYAHNYQTGQMFAPLIRYKEAATFAAAPVVQLDSLTGETIWIVFAAYVTEPDWGYISRFSSLSAFAGFIDEIRMRSMFVTDVDVTSGDRILTLSTCDQDFEDMRFVVHARQLRPGEPVPSAITASRNPDQKPYNLTNRQNLSDIRASRTAMTLNTAMNRLYFYQPRNGGIDWYTGNRDIVQGVFSNYSGPVTENSYISAAYDANPNQDSRMLYVAIDGYGGAAGIHLLTSQYLSGNLTYNDTHGLITPPGTEAKFPALQYDGSHILLLYIVNTPEGESVYMRRLTGGMAIDSPELLLTLPPNSGIRPLARYIIDGTPILFWHETATQTVNAAWLSNNIPFTTGISGSADRVTLYSLSSSGTIRAAVERDGTITFHTLSVTELPPHEDMYETPYPTESAESADDHDDTDEPPESTSGPDE